MNSSPYIKERNELENRLVKLYPYPKEWFEKQSISKLIAMLNYKK